MKWRRSKPEGQWALYLHIGHPKTGSTTIQAFLSKNRSLLAERGFHIAGDALDFTKDESGLSNPLHWFRANETIAPDEFTSVLKRSMAAVANSDAKFVISSEILFNPGFAKLFEPISHEMPVHLVYYIRRQDRVLLSAWRQWGMKRGLSLPEFIAYRMNSGLPNYEATIEEWLGVVAEERMRIRFLDPRFLAGGSLTDDFTAFLGTDADGFAGVGSANVSPDARLIRFLNRNPDLFQSVHDDAILNFLGSTEVGASDRRRDLRLPKNLFTLIQNRYEPRNAQLVKRWMPESEGLAVIDETDAPIGEETVIVEDNDHVLARLAALALRQDRTIAALNERIVRLEADLATIKTKAETPPREG